MGARTVPGRTGDGGVLCFRPSMDLERAVCRRRAIPCRRLFRRGVVVPASRALCWADDPQHHDARGVLATVPAFVVGSFALLVVDASAQLIRLSGVAMIPCSMWLVHHGNEAVRLKQSAVSDDEAPDLTTAAEASDVGAVKRLLEDGADSNLRLPE